MDIFATKLHVRELMTVSIMQLTIYFRKHLCGGLNSY